MKSLKSLVSCLECLSFVLWMIFTIFSIALAGLGIEGILFAALMLAASSTQPVHFPLETTALGFIGVFLSIFWRQVGIDYLHYLNYDSPGIMEDEEDAPSMILKSLISEVESSAGYARNDARSKAKQWIISHASSLDENDVQLANTHFGYMLPAGWDRARKE